MEVNEVEEGEACDDTDVHCDPDTAFSYIDEKLRLVLGDAQKDFEGGVFAEKLGSKVGGYGSFLPTHERTPSLFLYSTPVSQPKGPSEGLVEHMKQITASGTSSAERAGNRSRPFFTEKANNCLEVTSARGSPGDCTLAVLNIDSGTFTVRKKTGSESDLRRLNTAIYSGLGLEHSSSASSEDDLEDDQRSVSEMESSPDRSPLAMIRIMTSHELPDGALLSPLHVLILDSSDCRGKDCIKRIDSALNLENPREIVVDFLKFVDIPMEGREKSKGKAEEKLSKRKEENIVPFFPEIEANSDQSKRSKKSARRIEKEFDQSVLNSPAKVSDNGILKPVHNLPKVGDTDPESKPGEDTNFNEESGKSGEALIESMEKDPISKLRKETNPYGVSREAIRLSMKDKGFSTECTMVMSELVDHDSPLNDFEEVEFSKNLSRIARTEREFVEECVKEQLTMLDHTRDISKDLISSDSFVNGKKQKVISKNWSKEDSMLTEKAEEDIRKENILMDKEPKKHMYTCSDTGQTPEFEILNVDGEYAEDAVGEIRKRKIDAKDQLLAREPYKDKAKNNSGEVWKVRRKEANVRELSSKETTNCVSRERDTAKVRESQKEVEKEMIARNGVEPRKENKVKDGKTLDFRRRDSSKYGKDGEKDLALVKHHPVNSAATELLPSESWTEANLPEKKPLGEALAMLPTKDEAQTSAAPGIILENWVACDKCEQWRLLPPGIHPNQLPNKWRCKMLNWLQGMNDCRYTEEETTQALYARLGIPPPPSQFQVDPVVKEVPLPIVCSVVPTSNPTSGVSRLMKSSSKKSCKAEDVAIKLKSVNNVAHAPQEHKSMPGDDDVGYAQVMEEKDKAKEKEKKRLHASEDGRSKKHLVQEDGTLHVSWLHHVGGSNQHKKGYPELKPEEKQLKQLPIKSKTILVQDEALDTQYQANASQVQAEVSLLHTYSELNINGPRSGPLCPSDTATVMEKLMQDNDLKTTGKLQDTVSRVDGTKSSTGIPESSKQHKESSRNVNDASQGRAALNWSLNVPAIKDDLAAASPGRRAHGHNAANNVIREAKDLKHTADRLKGNGVDQERTNLYFRAALKFLHAAAMLEQVHVDNTKPGEMTQSMLIYAETALLCKYCATSYERRKELAAAALAYKCIGIAHMRVIWAQRASMNRDRDKLQTAFQMVAPDESPSSSSTSGVDNLHSQARAKNKLQLPATKGAVSHSPPQSMGNYVIPSRLRRNYERILHFVSDVTSALEALDKSQAAYAAAEMSSASTNPGKEGMLAVKNVVDFGFEDLESFLRLVRVALEALGQ